LLGNPTGEAAPDTALSKYYPSTVPGHDKRGSPILPLYASLYSSSDSIDGRIQSTEMRLCGWRKIQLDLPEEDLRQPHSSAIISLRYVRCTSLGKIL
jgi:hypothetical protein